MGAVVIRAPDLVDLIVLKAAATDPICAEVLEDPISAVVMRAPHLVDDRAGPRAMVTSAGQAKRRKGEAQTDLRKRMIASENDRRPIRSMMSREGDLPTREIKASVGQGPTPIGRRARVNLVITPIAVTTVDQIASSILQNDMESPHTGRSCRCARLPLGFLPTG
jgi:hypothetical protein